MDVINFSGGGPMHDPSTDPILEAVANVARAGVIPVISAGNDRDDFGFGTVGSPGVAEEAISVAAVSNSRMSTRRHITCSRRVRRVAAVDPDGRGVRVAGRRAADLLVDVTTIMGTSGRPVPSRAFAASASTRTTRRRTRCRADR